MLSEGWGGLASTLSLVWLCPHAEDRGGWLKSCCSRSPHRIDSSHLLQFLSGGHFHSRKKPLMSILLGKSPNVLQAPLDAPLEEVCQSSSSAKLVPATALGLFVRKVIYDLQIRSEEQHGGSGCRELMSGCI